jgi:hypothetical protein
MKRKDDQRMEELRATLATATPRQQMPATPAHLLQAFQTEMAKESACLPLGTVCTLFECGGNDGEQVTVITEYGWQWTGPNRCELGYIVLFQGSRYFARAGQLVTLTAPKNYSHLRLVKGAQ